VDTVERRNPSFEIVIEPESELRHRRPPRALKQRHRDAGYVLLCVATPTAACRVRLGAAVQDELVSYPWG
jgi:ferredoxin